MRNPLTYRVESSLGAVFVSMLALFFISFLFISIKNFNSDIDIMTAGYNTPNFRRVSQTESFLVQEWVRGNHIEIPEGRGYNYLVGKYPDRPWLD